MISPATEILILAVVVIGWFRLFGYLVYDALLIETSIKFVLFRHIPLWKIPYSEIAEIRPIGIWPLLTLKSIPLFFVSRPGAPLVLIKRNRGIFKNIVITPIRPNDFVAAVQQHAMTERT